MKNIWSSPDSKVPGANMGSTWVLSAPDGPHDGPMNLDIWVIAETITRRQLPNILPLAMQGILKTLVWKGNGSEGTSKYMYPEMFICRRST